MYDVALNIVFANSAQDGAKFLAEKFPDEADDPDYHDASAAFVQCIGKLPWIVLPWDADENIIAHESVHAAFEFHALTGVKSSYSNQEPLAYLVGWLTAALSNLLGDLNLERAKLSAKLAETERRLSDVIKRELRGAKR